MTTSDLVAGLREYAEAKEAWNSRDDFEQGCDTENLSRFSKAVMFMTDHASAIADEMERLAEQNERLKEAARYWNEARHIVPQPSTPRTWADDIVALRDLDIERERLSAENSRLRAEVERMRKILSSAFRTINNLTTHSIRDSRSVDDDAVATLTDIAFELEGGDSKTRDAVEVEGG